MRADVEAISEDGNSTMTTSAYDLSDYDRHLVALGVMSSFAFMGIIYSAALVAFNCRKGKDRIIKLTSPNINLVTCAGCVLSLLCIPLLGIERPITSDLKFISSLQQAGIFVLNIGQTIIYSSILVKTWRVHRIFKKMHLSSKGTKDEHLLLMIIGFSLVEIVINVLWLKLDHISCHFSANQDGLLVCWSEYQLLWSILLSGYKIIVILITLFYAWHVRHVKLPSLQDSSFILTNSLVIIAVTVISLPVVASARTANLTRLVTISLAILIWVFSTLSLLLAPKIFLVRNKDNSNSAVRFLFGESLKKKNMDKEDNHKPTGCCAKLRLCNSQSESSMGDSVLSQEIETLKQLIKEKDDSIRELTDRLFFGADRFKAYVHEKTTPRPKPQVVTDNYYASARKTKYSTAARSNQCSLGGRRNHTSPSLASPASSVDSGTVDDIYSTPQSRRLSKSADLSVRTMDTTLSPIREMSVGRELVELDKQGRQLNHQVSRVDSDRSATPTTDSAINMSQSSSEDEQRINRPSRHASSRPGSRRSQQSESDHISIAGSTKFRQLSLHSNQGGLEVAINNDLEGSASMTETDLCGTQRSAPTIPAKITTITDGKIDSALNSGLKQSRRADNGSSEMINKKPIASPRQHLPPRRLSNSTPSDNEEPYRLLTSQEHAMYEAVNKARHIILNEGSEPITEQDTKSQPITKDVNTHQPITRLSGRSNINRSNKSYIPTQVRPQTLSKSEMKSEAISDDKDTANNYLSDSVVGDEVELEIVFPKGKSLRYYSEL